MPPTRSTPGAGPPAGGTLLLLLNAGNRSRSYTLPKVVEPGRWEELINTARPGPWRRSVAPTAVNLAAHSSLLLRRTERLREPGADDRPPAARLDLPAAGAAGSGSTAPPGSCPTCTISGSRCSTFAGHARPRRGAPTATTWSTPAGSTRPSGRIRGSGDCWTALDATACGSWWTRCPTTSRPWPATGGGGTSCASAGPRRHAGVFDMDWAAQRRPDPPPGPGITAGRCAGVGRAHSWSRAARSGAGLRRPALPPRPRPGRRRGPGAPDEVAALLGRQHYRLAHWRLGRPRGTTGGSSMSTAGRRAGGGSRASTTPPTASSSNWSPTPGWPASASTTSTVWRTPAGTSGGCASTSSRPRGEPAALLVEKILARDEALAGAWPVDGTTGYEFADMAVGVLLPAVGRRGARWCARRPARVEDGGVRPLGPSSVAGQARDARHALRRPVRPPGRPTAAALDEALGRVPGRRDAGRGRAHSRTSPCTGRICRTCRGSIRRVPTGGCWPTGRADRDRDDEAGARRAVAVVVAGLLDPGMDPRPDALAEVRRRWQQLTGAVAAKGVEDTAALPPAGCRPWPTWVAHPMPRRVDVGGFHRWALSRGGRGARRCQRHVDPRLEAQRGRPGPALRPRRTGGALGPTACGVGTPPSRR